jgi:hypothetical protein
MKKTLMTLAMIASVFAFGASSALADANLYVAHGIPGVDVDVYVNYTEGADPNLPGFMFTQIVGPVTLPQGDYVVDIFVAGADPEVDEPVLSATLGLVDGQNITAVAHLDASGAPTVSTFGLDLRETADEGTRLGVRHTAAAPAVDVVIENESYVFRGADELQARISFNNGAGASTDLPAGAYDIFLTLPGTSGRIFPADAPLTLPLESDKIYYAYAVGVFPESFQLLLQVLDPVDDEGETGGNGGVIIEDEDEDDDEDDDRGVEEDEGPRTLRDVILDWRERRENRF